MIEIESIRVQNYKSCKDVKISMKEPVMALIGKNAAGKTNVLEGIVNASRYISSDKGYGFSVELELKYSGNRYLYKYKVYGKKESYIKDSLWLLKGKTKEAIFRKTGKKVLESHNKKRMPVPVKGTGLHYLVGFITFDKKSSEPDLLEEFGLSYYKNFFVRLIFFFLETRYYANNSQANLELFLKKEYNKWIDDKLYKEDSDLFSYQFYHFYLNRRQDFDEFKKIIESLDIVDEILIGEFTNPADNAQIIGTLFKLNNQNFSFNQLSEGTKRIIRLLFDFFYNKPSLMLIEEPETSIHFKLLEKMLSVFESYTDRRTKILFSSHSEQVLNVLKPEQVIYLSNKTGSTQAKYFKGKTLKSIKTYLDEIGPFGEYYTSGELEGDIDED